jgi:hypothetical protein
MAKFFLDDSYLFGNSLGTFHRLFHLSKTAPVATYRLNRQLPSWREILDFGGIVLDNCIVSHRMVAASVIFGFS